MLIYPHFSAAADLSSNQKITAEHAAFRATYEVLTLPGDESMGLLGLNYLISLTPWLYSGLAVYSAESGKRGGFFTGGLDAGLMFNIFSGLNLCGGFFAGGGGGGAAPQGGGLMLRPYAGLIYDFEFFKLGGGVSRNIFPNGDIDSTQCYMQLDIPFTIIFAADSKSDKIDLSDEDTESRGVSYHRISAVYETYTPSGEAVTTDGSTSQKSFGLAGITWSNTVSGPFFLCFQSAGAMKGESDGYAELFLGGGLRYYLTEHIGCEIKASAGGAGGGRVDTGGGFIYKGNAGGFVCLPGGVVLSAEGCYVDAPTGSFSGTGFIISLGGEFDIFSEGSGVMPVSEGDIFRPGRWRIRLRNKTYLSSENMRKNSDSEDDVNLIAFALDRFFHEYFYISGQAVGAYAGGAGGYAEGLFGVGLITGDIFYGARFFAEVSAGAGGGGGLATDGGAVVYPSAGVSWLIGESVSLEISAGLVRALKGELSAPVIEAGLGYRFAFFERENRRADD